MRTSAWALLCSVTPRTKRLRLSLRYQLQEPQPSYSCPRTATTCRSLHTSNLQPPAGTEKQPLLDNSIHTTEDPEIRQQLSYDGSNNGGENGPDFPKSRDTNFYGSAARRARRNKPPKELPPVYIPTWFLDKNVKLAAERKLDKDGTENPLNDIQGEEAHANAFASFAGLRKKIEGGRNSEGVKTKPSTGENDGAFRFKDSDAYESVFLEVTTYIRAGLRLPAISHKDVGTSKPHLVLCCPQPGASRYLREFVTDASRLSGRESDIIYLNPQDIAEIGGDYVDEPGKLQSNTLSSLSYDVSAMLDSRSTPAIEDQPEDEEWDDEEDDGSNSPAPESSFPRRLPQISSQRSPIDVGVGIIPIGSVFGNLQEALKGAGGHGHPSGVTGARSMPFRATREGNGDNGDSRMSLLVEGLIKSREIKQEMGDMSQPGAIAQSDSVRNDTAIQSATQDSSVQPRPIEKSLLILVEDYPQINMTRQGSQFLDKLHEIVDTKRREGQEILIIGTASARDIVPAHSRAGVRQAQTEPLLGPTRTVVIPLSQSVPEELVTGEQAQKTRSINLRHLRTMIRRLAPVFSQVKVLTEDWTFDIDREDSFLLDIDEKVLPLDLIDRISTLTLGLVREDEEVKASHIGLALNLIFHSDEKKIDWIKERRSHEKANKPAENSKVNVEEHMQRIKQKCNRYEKKLLSGVIDASNIKTTFADIRASTDTVEALRTLTSLSLVRPDAFTYGVLANNRIPGLLLYGPPGTGKTLLAKAVAKESGATVLEVSGSDVYDMYVGEGEKNIKAVFSLAKKLTPCVVFIDEADAILGSRGGANNRNSHRELINQFLREWDGMTEFNAFIMVATNRPFDLDEASLRRLPRRLLIDLPTEKDREEILKIHLRDEQLDSEVSLSQLASETPYYSGSDLKNLAVAAALACVREEMDHAAAHTGAKAESGSESEPYQYPEKRILTATHFKKAMEEISASISEDMRSLSAIRKFDEKYGDRRGRRKKLSSYGFKTMNENEKKGSDAARVRNQ